MMAHPSSPPRRPIADALHSAALRLLRRLRLSDKSSGVGPARLSALSVLVMGGERTLGQLADIEQVRPPTMSRLVAGLEAEGLARRMAGSEDRRRTWVAATARGRRVLQAARDRRLDALEELLADLDAAELDTLRRASAILGRLERQPSARSGAS